LLDTNVFIAAAKKGWTRTTEMAIGLLDGPEDLIANKALIAEYGKYAEDLGDRLSFCLDISCKRLSYWSHLMKRLPVPTILSGKTVCRCTACSHQHECKGRLGLK
jgi:hypothetical protein